MKNTTTEWKKRYSLRYLDWFLSLNCASDILERGLFGKCRIAKEITEAVAAFNAVKSVLGSSSFDDRSYTCVVVGDGVTPRCGGLFAFLTKWDVVSIDPKLRDEDWRVDRLRTVRARVEDVEPVKCDSAVIVSCHNHADVEATWNCAEAPFKLMVDIPCCRPVSIPHGAALLYGYRDCGIASPQNEVYLFQSEYIDGSDDE